MTPANDNHEPAHELRQLDGGSEDAPAPVDTHSDVAPSASDDEGNDPALSAATDPSVAAPLHPQPASLAGLPGASAPGQRIPEPATHAAVLGGNGAGASVPTDSKSQPERSGDSYAAKGVAASPAGVEGDTDRHFHPVKAGGIHVPHNGSIGP